MAWGNVNIPLGRSALDLEAGGTGSKTELVNAPPNSVIRKANEGYESLAYTPSTKGAFYSEGENTTPKFDTLPLTMGGTGSAIDLNEAPDNAIIRKETDTNSLKYIKSTKGAFYSWGTDELPKFGVLPLSLGGTGDGTTIIEAPPYSFITRGATEPASIGYLKPTAGALFCGGDEPKYGLLPLQYGGTGANLVRHEDGVLVKDGGSLATAKTLPLSKGGVGADNRIGAFNNLVSLPQNTAPTEDTPTKWAELGSFICYYSTSSTVINKPSTYGTMVQLLAPSSNGPTSATTLEQIWFRQGFGDVYVRAGSGNGWDGSADVSGADAWKKKYGSGDIIPMENGGTGTDLTKIDAGGILAKSSSGNTIVHLNTIPITKGGTGSTTASGARTALGLDKTSAYLDPSSNINTTSSSLAMFVIPHLKLCMLRGYVKLKEELATGTMLVVTTVPEAYKPASTYSLNAFYSGTGSIKARLRATDGAIQVFNTAATPTSYDIYISGVWSY